MPTNNPLAGALPELVKADAALRRLGAAQGIAYRIADFGGVRTQTDTTKILGYRDQDYKAAVKLDAKVAKIPIMDWRPIAQFGSSMHNYGAAFDVRPTQWPGNRDAAWAMQTLRALAPKAGLRVLNTKEDPWHFELPLTLDQARARYYAATGKPVASGASPLHVVVLVAALGIGIMLFAGHGWKSVR